MYKNCLALRENLNEDGTIGVFTKILFVSFICTFAILFIISNNLQEYMINNFTYPEEEYKALEDEATRLVLNNTFKTDYDFNINGYDYKTKDLSFTLVGQRAHIKVFVDNYNQSNQRYSTCRSFKSELDWTWKMIFLCAFCLFCLGIACFILSNVIALILYIVLSIIIFILGILKKKK